MENLALYKNEIDDLSIEYEVFRNNTSDYDKNRRELSEKIKDIENIINENNVILNELSLDIDRLTNNADTFDYIIAVSSGIICGFLDIFFVGELGLFKNASDSAKKEFQNSKGDVHEKMNKFI